MLRWDQSSPTPTAAPTGGVGRSGTLGLGSVFGSTGIHAHTLVFMVDVLREEDASDGPLLEGEADAVDVRVTCFIRISLLPSSIGIIDFLRYLIDLTGWSNFGGSGTALCGRNGGRKEGEGCSRMASWNISEVVSPFGPSDCLRTSLTMRSASRKALEVDTSLANLAA